MTASCPGGGTSSPKTGSAAVVIYSAGLLADLLVLVESPWLIPVIPLLGLAPLTLTTFCATDPPAMPTFTSAETNALLKFTLGADFDSGLSKFEDLVMNAAWQYSCQCDSGVATVPTPPAIPAGTPIVQAPAPQASTPCNSYVFNPFDGVTSTHIQAQGPPHDFGTIGTVAGPLNLTSLRVRATPFSTTGAGCIKTFNLVWLGPFPSASVLRTDVITITADGSMDRTSPVAATAWAYASTTNYVSGSGGDGLIYQVDEYCNGDQVGAVQSPCCPPDTSTQAYLDLILKQVTLIQRQAVPFSYVSGTAHAGLINQGTIAV